MSIQAKSFQVSISRQNMDTSLMIMENVVIVSKAVSFSIVNMTKYAIDLAIFLLICIATALNLIILHTALILLNKMRSNTKCFCGLVGNLVCGKIGKKWASKVMGCN